MKNTITVTIASKEKHRAEIRSRVEKLAKRLKEDPDMLEIDLIEHALDSLAAGQ